MIRSFRTLPSEAPAGKTDGSQSSVRRKGMNNIFYIVGVVVVALAVLGYLGLR
jgi:flagellar basal body-associated protein FliL